MAELILVTGAARSGKSTFAEKLAASFGKEVIYLATAQALDNEMEIRIARHREGRPAEWLTVEEPLEVAKVVAEYAGEDRIILLDCVTLWLTNLMLKELENHTGEINGLVQTRVEKAALAKVQELLEVCQAQPVNLICVSNEVGWGVVPDTELGRIYRDLAGRANQALGREANRVYLVSVGYPMEIKGPGSKLLQQLEGNS